MVSAVSTGGLVPASWGRGPARLAQSYSHHPWDDIKARAIREDWTARAEAFRLMTDDADVRRTLDELGIIRIDWRMLRDVLRQGACCLNRGPADPGAACSRRSERNR
jgi:hypothetical protein